MARARRIVAQRAQWASGSPLQAARCSLLIALFRRLQPYSATQSLFKVESDINGILPAADGGPLPFISFLS